ncbi:MAG TPA: carboxypeptidase-like regulatory domain-containing protein [Bryobacteraceae bacterium]|jgi:hypothetical protein
MATVRGTVVDQTNSTTAGVKVRLAPIDGSSPSINVACANQGRFEFPDVTPRWYILSVGENEAFLETVRVIHVVDGSTEVGDIDIRLGIIYEGPTAINSVPVLTVCEALARPAAFNQGNVVIVGIFKSGMDETLRLDCPTQLTTGEVGWPSSIGLTRPSNPPDYLREEIEKKRQEILKSGPPGAQPRPERVVALFGLFVALEGLTVAPCCSTPIETVLPPARLFGIGEKDLRVIL